MSNRILFLIIGFAIAVGLLGTVLHYLAPVAEAPAVLNPDTVCPQDAQVCPNGTSVGRTGSTCEFVCPDENGSVTGKATGSLAPSVTTPLPQSVVSSPLTIKGEVTGAWFFEATAPALLLTEEGTVVAEGYITALEDWMTTAVVPFVGTLTFAPPASTSPLTRGLLILKKSNPSGLPENDEAFEIPVVFAP